MNEILTNYCKACLTAPQRKPYYKKVTNDSFANFIVVVSDSIEELRKCDTDFYYKNYEKGFRFTSGDLKDLMNEGLTVLLDCGSSKEAKENGAEQIDLNDGSEEEEDEKPKITKIVRVNKD